MTEKFQCSYVYDFRKKQPAKGDLLYSADGRQCWECIDTQKRIRRDGQSTIVFTWQSECSGEDCGKPFHCTTGLSSKNRAPASMCKDCARGWKARVFGARNPGKGRKSYDDDEISDNPRGEPVRENDESMADYTKRLKQWKKERKG